jgi:cell wall-associated NlpC family hydrolase
MRGYVKFLITPTFALALSGWVVTSPPQEASSNSTPRPAVECRSVHDTRGRTLNKNDRSSVIAVAFAVALHAEKARHTEHERNTEHDCSHLVHSIYESAGFPYPYMDSEDLYDGVKGFVRVESPQPGDLVVWHGHVGIVIHPSGHEFLSLLRTGPGISDYRSRYWQGRGEPRFYRYIKNDS